MTDDVVLNKVDTIKNCLKRIDEIYSKDHSALRNNQDKQDAIILNLERACQGAIDIAMRVVKLKKLGLPKESRDAFDFLEKAQIIPNELLVKMHGLVGFRNTAVHNYKKLDLDIVEFIIQHRLSDLTQLCQILLALK